jgi:hypothetical protein
MTDPNDWRDALPGPTEELYEAVGRLRHELRAIAAATGDSLLEASARECGDHRSARRGRERVRWGVDVRRGTRPPAPRRLSWQSFEALLGPVVVHSVPYDPTPRSTLPSSRSVPADVAVRTHLILRLPRRARSMPREPWAQSTDESRLTTFGRRPPCSCHVAQETSDTTAHYLNLCTACGLRCPEACPRLLVGMPQIPEVVQCFITGRASDGRLHALRDRVCIARGSC